VTATTSVGDPFGWGLLYSDVIAVATPAAGANAPFTVPGECWLRVVAARLSLTTDANAANRLVSLDFVDGRGSTRVRNAASVVVTASTTAQTFEWSRNRTIAEWNTNTPVFAPVLNMFLPSGWVVQFTVDSKQATDQISGLSLVVEKFPTGAKGYPQGVTEESVRELAALRQPI
jgi:hypothetical protein